MLYNLICFICRVVLVLLRRWEVRGLDNLPTEGGLVLMANHTSYWDPPAVACAVSRKVYFIAKAELFKIPLLGAAMRVTGMIPLKRGKSDRDAIRAALKRLREGQIVGIFPEGTRNSGDGLLEPHLGAAMLAFRAGVPMLPVAVGGARGVVGKITVSIGKPMVYQIKDGDPNRQDMRDASAMVMRQIATLLKNINEN